MRVDCKEAQLKLAMIGSVLLLTGKKENLERFKKTRLTFLVDSLEDHLNYLQKTEITILENPKKVPTGKNMRVQHPDGTVVQYVEYKNNNIINHSSKSRSAR